MIDCGRMMMDCGWISMMGMGMLLMVLFWIIVIAGIVYLVKWLTGHGIAGRPETALDILKKRYARGEIHRQEYEEMKKELQV